MNLSIPDADVESLVLKLIEFYFYLSCAPFSKTDEALLELFKNKFQLEFNELDKKEDARQEKEDKSPANSLAEELFNLGLDGQISNLYNIYHALSSGNRELLPKEKNILKEYVEVTGKRSLDDLKKNLDYLRTLI